MHLQGHGESKDDTETGDSLREVFVWKDVIGNNIAATNLKFRDLLLPGKKRPGIYWLKMTEDTPYFYAASSCFPT